MKPWLASVVILALAGCATLPRSSAPQPVETTASLEATQLQREAALGLAEGRCEAPAWEMAGRVALSNGKDGGSGRIEWAQAEGRAAVTLSAPVTRQSWTLRNAPTGAVLEGVPDGPRTGADAEALLRETTGWQIPVDALGCWLRGARAAPASGAVQIAYGANGLPVRIEQGGWVIDYSGWGSDGDLAVPTRINAQRGQDRVRLVVDRWGSE